MRNIMVFSVVTILSAAPAVAQNQAVTPVNSSSTRVARADLLEARALELHSRPDRALEAARLHIESAQLRASSDPAAVQSLALAAYLFSYARRPLEARRTMERVAERALAIGDVGRAAQAYVEATFLADQQGNRQQTARLGRKALLLSMSPLLTPEQRLAIQSKVRVLPSLASLEH